jgi:ribosomal protein S24E
MNVQITIQKHNALMSRKEISAVLTYEKQTPSKEELKKSLSHAMKLDENLMVIKSVYPGYGKQKAQITIYQYDNPEMMARLEPKKKEKKQKQAEATKE